MSVRLTCAEETCTESIPNHRWGKTKAVGWFFAQSGRAWCPAHTPEWVEDWRRKRDRTEEGR